MVKLAQFVVAVTVAAGCAGGEPPVERSVDLHASAQPEDTLYEALLRKHTRLLNGIRDLDREQLAPLLTSDFVLMDLRAANDTDGSDGDSSSLVSLSYFMILSGEHVVELPGPDAVRQPCRMTGNDRMIMVRLGRADWAATSWRDEAGEWRTHRLMLLRTAPSGEPPIRGAVCGDPAD
jgi:hypothetical protein